MSTPQPPRDSRITIRDLWEIISVPVLLSGAVIAATWLVWYYTSPSCSTEMANITGCNPGRIARYINLEVLSRILTHTAIAASGGGIWSYIMITRERKAREAAEKNLTEERAQSAAEREQAAAERAELLARLDAAQSQAAEERRLFLAAIERLTQQLNGGAPADSGAPG